MSEMVKATETFAWSGGLVHWESEWRADAEVVKQFPQFFEPVTVEQPETKRVGRKPKAAGNA